MIVNARAALLLLLSLLSVLSLVHAARSSGRSSGRSSYSRSSYSRSSYSRTSYSSRTRTGSSLTSRYVRYYPGARYSRPYYSGYYSYYYSLYYRNAYLYANYRGSSSSGVGVCVNYVANDNGTYMGVFTCPLPFEPNSFTACCGEEYAEYCCKYQSSSLRWWITLLIIITIGTAVFIFFFTSRYLYQRNTANRKCNPQQPGQRPRNNPPNRWNNGTLQRQPYQYPNERPQQALNLAPYGVVQQPGRFNSIQSPRQKHGTPRPTTNSYYKNDSVYTLPSTNSTQYPPNPTPMATNTPGVVPPPGSYLPPGPVPPSGSLPPPPYEPLGEGATALSGPTPYPPPGLTPLDGGVVPDPPTYEAATINTQGLEPGYVNGRHSNTIHVETSH